MRTVVALFFASLFSAVAMAGAVPLQESDRPLTRGSYRKAANIALPSVVTITVKAVADYSAALEKQKEGGGGTGSGIVVSADGLVVTNGHVVPDGPVDLTVTLSDGRKFKAVSVGKAIDTDIAVIRIQGSPADLVAAQLRGGADLSPGEVVIAIGAPLGLHNTVTHGVVSAIRPPGADNPLPHAVIQSDAAINPGNSGGALVDLDGRVIGMNTFIRSAGGGSIGLGFAIPADVVRTVVSQLAGESQGGNGWIGLSAQDLNEGLRQAFGIAANVVCVVVTGTEPDSPAARAGLKQGDCITAVNDMAIGEASRLLWTVRNMTPGTAVKFTVASAGGSMRNVSVPVAARP